MVEPESGKFQPLPEVQGKGKKKVSDEQVALDQLHLQTPNESESDEEVPGIVASIQDEGQAGPNPGEHDEGQAGPNPGDAAASQPPSSHVVHAGPDLEHMDLEASDTSIQPNPEQMDEEFTTTAYPNVQENLKLPTEGEVRLEEPASSAGTLSSLQHLDKELSFADQFLVEKSQEDEPEKTNTESEVQSMVTVPIHQDTSSVPLMTTPRIRELEQIGGFGGGLNSPGSKIRQNSGHAIQAPLRDRFRDLLEADMKDILHHRMWESNSYQAHEDHKQLTKKKKKRHASLKTPPGSPPHQPPPPLPPAGSSGTPGASGAFGFSSKTIALAEYTAWTTTDTRLKPSVLSIPEELHMDDDMTPNEQVQSSGDEDIGHDHIPTVNLRQNWWKPLTEDRLATPEPAWSIPLSDLPVPVNNWAFVLVSTYAPPPENLLLA
ncbi:hypothetical protein Tco_0773253 [Tanacetum coccineum]|uniref:Uncharacterized protein n=1 Tax=Tanacetum coccineum TaxID=301880 RepID=A0ABQ4ZL77_9ASTR